MQRHSTLSKTGHLAFLMQNCPECAAPMRIVAAEWAPKRREVLFICNNGSCPVWQVQRSSEELAG